MRAKEIINLLDDFCKPELIDKWDNTGFQVGSDEVEVTKILIALDLDEIIVDRAVNENFNMIITHHPILFKPLKSINNNSYIGKLILKLISNNIVVYNAHSNLDLAEGGVNDELANLLELKVTNPLNVVKENQGIQYGYGRIGDITKVNADEFIYKLKEKLCVEDIRVYGNTNKVISRIGVCGGSGGDFIIDAYKNGADVYVTGDIKYHEAQLGLQLGLIIIDAGHFHTEKIILSKLKDILATKVNNQIKIEVDTNTQVSYKIW